MVDRAERTAGAAGGSPGDGTAADPVVLAAMRGDRAAIRSLWERHRRWVAAVLIAHKPSFEDLDDLLQEVAVTFVDKVTTIRESGNVAAWLRSVAVNAARAAGRSGRYRRSAELPAGDLPGNGPLIDRALGAQEELERMLDRLRALPAAYREPLLLRSLHGMRSRQISEILDIPPATIDTRIARARRMLREIEDGADPAEIADLSAVETSTSPAGLSAGRQGGP